MLLWTDSKDFLTRGLLKHPLYNTLYTFHFIVCYLRPQYTFLFNFIFILQPRKDTDNPGGLIFHIAFKSGTKLSILFRWDFPPREEDQEIALRSSHYRSGRNLSILKGNDIWNRKPPNMYTRRRCCLHDLSNSGAFTFWPWPFWRHCVLLLFFCSYRLVSWF